MADGGSRITIDVVPLILASIEQLTHQQVLVGIPGNVPDRKWTGVGITNAAIGYVQEFGSPAKNIPARPFLRPGVSAAIPAIVSRLRAGARRAISAQGDPEAGAKALHAAGLTAQNSVRAYMNAGVAPPLAFRTLYARKHRKVAPRQGETPLIDTAQLRNSVTYVIRRVR